LTLWLRNVATDYIPSSENAYSDLQVMTACRESAEDVMALLREYHAAIGKIIIKYSGTLERYAFRPQTPNPTDVRFWGRSGHRPA
jgi:hypothetical protein